MVWILSDDSMRELLGDFEACQIKEAVKENPNISLKKMFKLQFKYITLSGFIHFVRTRLHIVLSGGIWLDDDSIAGKIIKKVFKCERQTKRCY